MFMKRIGLVALLGGLGLGTAACTDGYGYSGVGLGYSAAGYYGDPYYDGWGGGGWGGAGWGGAGWGGGPSYFGWYNNFYYPGTGVYVYDRYRRPFRWNDSQRRYWQGRGNNYWAGRNPGDRRELRQNWQGFRQQFGEDRRDYRQDLRGARQDLRQGEINRGQFRDRRMDARRELRQDYRQERGQLNRRNRRDLRN